MLHFRFGDHDPHKDHFRNPIWQSDDDDDDIDDFRLIKIRILILNYIHFEFINVYLFRHHGTGMLNIFIDSIKMSRYFELQMDNMLKNVFGSNFPGTFILCKICKNIF